MVQLTVTQSEMHASGQRIWVKIDETGPDDTVTDAIVARGKPASGSGYFWKQVNILQLSGLWATGRTTATLTIDDQVHVVAID